MRTEVNATSSIDDEVPYMADLIVKAGRVYAIDDRRSAFRSFAVRDGRAALAAGGRRSRTTLRGTI